MQPAVPHPNPAACPVRSHGICDTRTNTCTDDRQRAWLAYFGLVVGKDDDRSRMTGVQGRAAQLLSSPDSVKAKGCLVPILRPEAKRMDNPFPSRESRSSIV